MSASLVLGRAARVAPVPGLGLTLGLTVAWVGLVVVIPLAAVEPHVKAGKLRVLAASTDQRSPRHPDIPTFAELGYKRLTVSSWAGLSAPKGTPPDVVRKLNAALNAGLARPQIVQGLEQEGMFSISTSPEEYNRMMHSDLERWGQLTRSLKLKAN